MRGDLKRPNRNQGNHKYFLVCVETVTRWVENTPLPNLKAATLTSAIDTSLLGLDVETLVCDQQSAFISELIRKLLQVLSLIAMAGFHTATATAERYVHTAEQYLKSYLSDYEGVMLTKTAQGIKRRF
jgi:hypothetical protein